MGKYILSRLLESAVVLLMISIVAFGLIRLAPGDPAMALYGDQIQKMRPEDRERIRENLGLNQPLPLQYCKWIKGIVRGDMGRSYMSGDEVSGMIAERLPATILLAGAASRCFALH